MQSMSSVTWEIIRNVAYHNVLCCLGCSMALYDAVAAREHLQISGFHTKCTRVGTAVNNLDPPEFEHQALKLGQLTPQGEVPGRVPLQLRHAPHTRANGAMPNSLTTQASLKLGPIVIETFFKHYLERRSETSKANGSERPGHTSLREQDLLWQESFEIIKVLASFIF